MSATAPVFLGVIALAVGLAVLSLVAIYASMPSASRAVSPPPNDQPGRVYSCYCWDRPLRVLIVDPAATIRIDAPPDTRPASRGRHAKNPPPDHRNRPNHVSHAGADGGEGGVRPVPVAA
ncbi:hypothetical protein GCM10010329_17470 [Streptomyces spiroverticillatus]|uniref:Uncharacterized protein n=1 Tax=Streptomyces finlayi TaxID=67296 RepID=A0A919C8E3_9ACTN|nr:hypothetical protein GCM10010329_17470 [Streptomyces spiroverticillatus]GHC82041.1 hypothetical protein GCM10010334_09950 [Streptomyces finlayi]